MSEEKRPTRMTAQITLKSGAQIEFDLDPQAEVPIRYERDQHGEVTFIWTWAETGRQLIGLSNPADIAAIVLDRSYEEES